MDLVRIFKDTLELSKKFFGKNLKNSYYKNIKEMKIIWSENTVNSIFKLKGYITVLNFADDKQPGGLVWFGAETQEECLCRCSNLYLFLEKAEDYYNNREGIIYSKGVIFFKGEDYKLREPKKVDVISCAAIGREDEIRKKMRMILESAELNGVEYLVLGKWGCGAFGRDWLEMKNWWEEEIGKFFGKEYKIVDM